MFWYPIKLEIFKRSKASACTWKTYWGINHKPWGHPWQKMTLIFLGVIGVEIMWRQPFKLYLWLYTKRRKRETKRHI